ncbi:MAG: L-fucose/L-arabinose isomerase family protein [Caldilineaceae bacterium]|nr:L-fucose/L-arabinose isomerase family protein [Caldilineaceae bacterium]
MNPELSIALVSIARPTFDVLLAQSVADTVYTQLQWTGYRVVGTGAKLIIDAAGVEEAKTELQNTQFDLLILLQASFADSSMAVTLAEVVQDRALPLLLWAVPEDRSGGRLRLNSLCGINLAAHALKRRNIAYDYLLLPADAPQALDRIEQVARAGRTQRLLRGSRIGLVGEPPTGFDTCHFDAAELASRFGVQVVPLALGETLQAAADVSTERCQEFVDRVAVFVPNLDELNTAATAGTAGVYTALRDRAQADKLDGIAVRCWPEFFTELGCAACGAMSMLTEEAIPCSCEADINGTLTLVMLQAISDSQPFITDLVNVDAESDSAVLWHCGLAPISMADPGQPIEGTIHSNRRLPLLFQFTLKPGRVTLARLHHTPQSGYQLVIGGGEMIAAPPSFSGTSGVVRFDRPVLQVLDTIMAEGLEHHLCLVYGDYRSALRAFARLADLPVLDLT